MKSPDKIKKGLGCCADGNIVCAGNCVFDDDVKLGYPDCVKLLMSNALAYIQQLEATVSEKEKVISELSGKVGQLEAERDAAVNDIEFDGACEVCKHIEKDAGEPPCNNCFHVNKGKDSYFEWRGAQKEG